MGSGRFGYKETALPEVGSLLPPVAAGKRGVLWPSSRQAAERAQSVALLVSLAWMVLAQIGCVMFWDAGFLPRQAFRKAREDKPGVDLFFPYDGHWNKHGHSLAAETVYQYLRTMYP